MPMVTRGVPLPREKILYILTDCAREGRRLRIPFGHISDPFGPAVDRALALSSEIRNRGKLFDFAHAYLEAVFGKGVNLHHRHNFDALLHAVGLEDLAESHEVGDEDLTWATENANALRTLGLWGVPSFRIGKFSTWGRDRMFLVYRQMFSDAPSGQG